MNTILAKVTSKGQVTLPKKIRDALSIRAGDHLSFTTGPSQTLSVRRMGGAGSSAGCAKSLVNAAHTPLTEEQVKQAIRMRMKQKYGLKTEGG